MVSRVLATENMPSSDKEQLKISTGSARLYFIVALVSGMVLLSTHVFDRIELQTINARFDLRRWINWSGKGPARLNPVKLWQYHEQHEIPRQWWAWDYTLSWLLEDNHPISRHHFILFNHQLEDEPPLEALNDHPWMKPLVQYPLSRGTVGDILIFLARSGVKEIIMDNDFPQFSPEDANLAKAITACRTGTAAGHRVPVLMARTINHHSTSNILQLEIPTAPSGLLTELSKLMKSVDPLEELTGSTGVTMDEDQVVRRLASQIPTMSGKIIDSIPIKALKDLGEPLPDDIPLFMDIDFAGPPNSEIYPVRPISYLLDPDRQKEMTGAGDSGDIKLAGATVILGDSVVDVFNTPTTNFGVNQMSGAEILANAIDTISRRSWLYRLDFWQQAAYLTSIVLTGALILFASKTAPFARKRYEELDEEPHGELEDKRAEKQDGQPAKASGKVSAAAKSTRRRGAVFNEFLFFIMLVAGSYIVAAVLFAQHDLVVPVVVPAIALSLASLATVQWEREQERVAALKRELKAAQDKLSLQSALHKSDLSGQKALADAREAALDKERRKEFARRINHDLRAPVSVLSWTIAKLRSQKLTEEEKLEKIDRLSKTADRMFGLINELVSTYNSQEDSQAAETTEEISNINEVLQESVRMQQVLAEERHGTIKYVLSPTDCQVRANALQLSRVFDNIIRNAFLHNEKSVDVVVSLVSNERNAQVRILDNGKGIAPEHLDKIFTPGYRVDKKIDTSASDGQGLGLDIVNSFVENMKGSVSVESTIGEGTTFIITLPRFLPGKAHSGKDDTDSHSDLNSVEAPNATKSYSDQIDGTTASVANPVEQPKARGK
jgi:signal transduction histidine kinase